MSAAHSKFYVTRATVAWLGGRSCGSWKRASSAEIVTRMHAKFDLAELQQSILGVDAGGLYAEDDSIGSDDNCWNA